ncbi:MAG: type II secretion system protein [Patescibacteria group bacterium]
MFIKKLQPNSDTAIKGFTLVEVLVSISIVTVMMVVVLYNYGRFTDRLALTAAGQEIAVTIRQAQTYGLSVRELTSSPGSFSSGYGTYFTLSDPTSYYLFADVVADKMYGIGSVCGAPSTECVQRFALRNGIRISRLCSVPSIGAPVCAPATSSFNAMSVTFLRPNPDANIRLSNSGLFYADPLTSQIVLVSPQGTELVITIESTGQVLVNMN